MKTKVISASTSRGFEQNLNAAISNLEAQDYEVLSISPWSLTYRAIILYK
ncbi:hypothetical protein [Fructobacillus evanidus]|uniref:NADPH-dependent FMN reductase n=1 Tax=Fructobacillus evanidus TaxID=3064281 RepID=A0ABM9MPJ2_9LACO|nr:unnamed protein product [Fructobacillus sp. LMG 32999]CAK1230507.1 unnamed protein product [Fructobacillus sp. LMG 32999]CAK1234056.1 unnamed protein product [Fructobacillus sp. LMG 32999]CAK1234513.1 unnamed protein product [Fructobacillus sp. LMG 32999]CAK1238637.1 unnamed protein product [Fructobacillus sp. LMG 32999]